MQRNKSGLVVQYLAKGIEWVSYNCLQAIQVWILLAVLFSECVYEFCM